MTPAMHGANRGVDQLGNGTSPAKSIDDYICLSVHGDTDMRYSQLSQVENCDNRFCEIRINQHNGIMDNESLMARLDALNLKQRDIAVLLDISADKVSKVFNGVRQWRASELAKITQWLEQIEAQDGYVIRSDVPVTERTLDYIAIDILPSYAGMGGGGNGDGDLGTGLVPRSLVQDELRAKPSDLLLLEARGESMAPDFLHGDQILIDKRDCNPIQPGSFALWDGDGYVIKLVERVPHKPGYYRIFSANTRYSAYEVEAEQVKIMGRPVWFARRL